MDFNGLLRLWLISATKSAKKSLHYNKQKCALTKIYLAELFIRIYRWDYPGLDSQNRLAKFFRIILNTVTTVLQA